MSATPRIVGMAEARQTSLSENLLNSYVNEEITDICPHGFTDSSFNHCAHFVCHAMSLSVGYTCRAHSGSKDKAPGAGIRVHELFAHCPRVGKLDSAPLSAPPKPKQALQLLLTQLYIPLSVDKSCRDVGTSPDDQSIGDYLAGFLAEQAAGSNQIQTTCAAIEQGASQCQVLLKHQDEEDEWAWGLSFKVRATDGQIERTSVRCLGAG